MDKFDPKDPLEIVPLYFDFTVDLQGQTISSAAVAVTVYSGTDGSPAAILSGGATIVGDKIKQLVTGGLQDVEYLIRVTVTTSAGNKYTIGHVLPVKLAGTW